MFVGSIDVKGRNVVPKDGSERNWLRVLVVV